mmetsp:Transcript_31137/g.81615  ORF Transcript_31137/g.81615 Transcript_31137/m.81615 type:complete len:248 (-) Transcript_31137:666-1409(-)
MASSISRDSSSASPTSACRVRAVSSSSLCAVIPATPSGEEAACASMAASGAPAGSGAAASTLAASAIRVPPIIISVAESFASLCTSSSAAAAAATSSVTGKTPARAMPTAEAVGGSALATPPSVAARSACTDAPRLSTAGLASAWSAASVPAASASVSDGRSAAAPDGGDVGDRDSKDSATFCMCTVAGWPLSRDAMHLSRARAYSSALPPGSLSPARTAARLSWANTTCGTLLGAGLSPQPRSASL